MEVKAGLDPLDANSRTSRVFDLDGDGLLNGDELRIGTDPTRRDSDGDGLDDGFEKMHGLDPTSASNSWQQYDHDGDGVDDRTENRGGTNRYDANEYPASPTPVPAPDTSMEATPDQDLSIGAPITDADALGAQSTLLGEALPEQFAIVVDEPQAFEPVQVDELFVEEPFVEEPFVDELPDLIELDVDSNGDYFA
jgi:hypothetical protein